MKTILVKKASIAQLWGFPKPKDTTYRLMKYLLKTEVEEGILLHNVVTGHLVLLNKDEAEQLSQLPLKPTEPMKELIANHFLVPEDFNEYRAVKQLRAIYQQRFTGEAINHYIILPTTFCNAHCFYCYENDYPRVHMTEETAERVINYIAEHRKDKNVIISWFGGEPLIGMRRIDQISQGLKDRRIPFAASMISNGYLFDEEIIERSVKLWHLERVQITLDGTEEVYNQVKAYVNVEGSPFQRVLRNIELLSKNGVRVNIRLNVDHYNKDNIQSLIEELGRRYSNNQRIKVYLNMLFNHQGYEPVHYSEQDRIELMEIIDDYTKRLKEHKLGSAQRKIPSLETNQCMADNPHAVEIQPDGSLCRCEHESILDSYGNIDKGILEPNKLLRWKATIERSDYCPECPVYPACYLLSRCMNAETPCVESLRLKGLQAYEELIRSVFFKSLEGKV